MPMVYGPGSPTHRAARENESSALVSSQSQFPTYLYYGTNQFEQYAQQLSRQPSSNLMVDHGFQSENIKPKMKVGGSQVKLGDLLGSSNIAAAKSQNNKQSSSLNKRKKQIANLKQIRGLMMAIDTPDISKEKAFLRENLNDYVNQNHTITINSQKNHKQKTKDEQSLVNIITSQESEASENNDKIFATEPITD